MRATALSLISLCLIGACSDADTTSEMNEQEIERAIAEVEAAQTPPPDVVSPQRITAADRDRYQFSSSGCDFAVDAPELGAIAILQLNIGYMQFDDTIERFAPDVGGGEGPMGTSEHYDSGRHSLTVEYFGQTDKPNTSKSTDYLARITLKDGRDRTVYIAEGVASCGD